MITGMGVICGAGRNIPAFTDALLSGKSCLSKINDSRITHFNVSYAGLIGELRKEDLPSGLRLSECDRFVKLASIAAYEALSMASLTPATIGGKTGLIVGTCSGPMLTIEKKYEQLHKGLSVDDRDSIFSRQYWSAADILAGMLSINGPSFTITTACSAFTAAVTVAVDLIRIGILDTVLVGGADAFSPTTLAGFAGLRAVTDSICAPFSRPSGLNLGEGAGFLVIESQENANSRKVDIFGEILGYGLSNDAYHCSAPDPSGRGAVLSMKRALENAGISPDEIGYISAHGTGTEANDKTETRALIKVFGDHAGSIPVSSQKSMVGHCLGAAGAVETIAALACARKGIFPSTTNFSTPREGCTLDYIPEPGRRWTSKKVFLKNNFAFGGNNASLVISTDVNQIRSKVKSFDEDPICITGVGIISSAGIGMDCLHNAMKSTSNLSASSTSEKDKKFIVKDFDISRIDRRIDTRSMDRAGKMAVAAASLALQSGKFPERPSARADLGFYMSIAQGATWAEREHIAPLVKNSFHLEQVNVFPFIVPNSVTGTICRTLSLTGHNITFCNGPGAGLSGLNLAWAAMKNGHASSFLCGSVDDLTADGLSECCNLQKTYGTAIGEGSVMLLLDRSSHAKARGAVPLGIIRAASFSNESRDQRRGNLAVQIKLAMDEAGISADQIGIVCCSKRNSQEISSVESIIGYCRDRIIDVSEVIGYVPAGLPLFDIGVVLTGSILGFNMTGKYILTIFSSTTGDNITIIEKNFDEG